MSRYNKYASSSANWRGDRRRRLERELVKAIEAGDLERATELVQNSRPRYMRKALHEYFVNKPNFIVQQQDCFPLLESMVNAGVDVNWRRGKLERTPLHCAVSYDVELREVNLLLKAGADSRLTFGEVQRNALHQACFRGVPAGVVRTLLQHEHGQELLAAGDKWRNTALHLACEGFGSSAALLNELFEAEGCEVDARNCDGVTPLMLAALMGRVETVRSLLEHGADKTARSTGTYKKKVTHLLRNAMPRFANAPGMIIVPAMSCALDFALQYHADDTELLELLSLASTETVTETE